MKSASQDNFNVKEEVECPCKRISCKRHGNCELCRTHHAKTKIKMACERSRKKVNTIKKNTFDRNKFKPVIHVSICNGEKVAGFKNVETGKFLEVMLLQNDADLKKFMKQYGIEKNEISKEY